VAISSGKVNTASLAALPVEDLPSIAHWKSSLKVFFMGELVCFRYMTDAN
jgi:hypothetical protein